MSCLVPDCLGAGQDFLYRDMKRAKCWVAATIICMASVPSMRAGAASTEDFRSSDSSQSFRPMMGADDYEGDIEDHELYDEISLPYQIPLLPGEEEIAAIEKNMHEKALPLVPLTQRAASASLVNPLYWIHRRDNSLVTAPVVDYGLWQQLIVTFIKIRFAYLNIADLGSSRHRIPHRLIMLMLQTVMDGNCEVFKSTEHSGAGSKKTREEWVAKRDAKIAATLSWGAVVAMAGANHLCGSKVWRSSAAFDSCSLAGMTEDAGLFRGLSKGIRPIHWGTMTSFDEVKLGLDRLDRIDPYSHEMMNLYYVFSSKDWKVSSESYYSTLVKKIATCMAQHTK